jgi:hypothetical protein
MPRERLWSQCRALVALLVLGCSIPQGSAPGPGTGDPDVVRPPPGGPPLKKLPGPMLGPFESPQEGLLAACNRILRKPHATAGRKDHPQFEVRWRVSSEYCAWMYYTPDDKYLISKLTSLPSTITCTMTEFPIRTSTTLSAGHWSMASKPKQSMGRSSFPLSRSSRMILRSPHAMVSMRRVIGAVGRLTLSHGGTTTRDSLLKKQIRPAQRGRLHAT